MAASLWLGLVGVCDSPARCVSGGARVVGVSRGWSGCRGGLGVVVGFGDGGSGAGFVDEAFAGSACGDERGDGESVDGAGFAAAGFVDQCDGVVGEQWVRAAGELEV